MVFRRRLLKGLALLWSAPVCASKAMVTKAEQAQKLRKPCLEELERCEKMLERPEREDFDDDSILALNCALKYEKHTDSVVRFEAFRILAMVFKKGHNCVKETAYNTIFAMAASRDTDTIPRIEAFKILVSVFKNVRASVRVRVRDKTAAFENILQIAKIVASSIQEAASAQDRRRRGESMGSGQTEILRTDDQFFESVTEALGDLVGEAEPASRIKIFGVLETACEGFNVTGLGTKLECINALKKVAISSNFDTEGVESSLHATENAPTLWKRAADLMLAIACGERYSHDVLTTTVEALTSLAETAKGNQENWKLMELMYMFRELAITGLQFFLSREVPRGFSRTHHLLPAREECLEALAKLASKFDSGSVERKAALENLTMILQFAEPEVQQRLYGFAANRLVEYRVDPPYAPLVEEPHLRPPPGLSARLPPQQQPWSPGQGPVGFAHGPCPYHPGVPYPWPVGSQSCPPPPSQQPGGHGQQPGGHHLQPGGQQCESPPW